jgi:threonine synthase
VAARDESGGIIDTVTDAEILAAQKIMAAEGGIFGEPASAAPLAGLIKLLGKGMDFSGSVIACVVTGTGLKDTEAALKDAPSFLELPDDLAEVEKALGWG